MLYSRNQECFKSIPLKVCHELHLSIFWQNCESQRQHQRKVVSFENALVCSLPPPTRTISFTRVEDSGNCHTQRKRLWALGAYWIVRYRQGATVSSAVSCSCCWSSFLSLNCKFTYPSQHASHIILWPKTCLLCLPCALLSYWLERENDWECSGVKRKRKKNRRPLQSSCLSPVPNLGLILIKPCCFYLVSVTGVKSKEGSH